MSKVEREFVQSIRSGEIQTYGFNDEKIPLLKYTYLDSINYEFPLLVNDQKQWRFWVSKEGDSYQIHRSSAILTGKQRKGKVIEVTSKVLHDALGEAFTVWKKQQEKGWAPHEK